MIWAVCFSWTFILGMEALILALNDRPYLLPMVLAGANLIVGIAAVIRGRWLD